MLRKLYFSPIGIVISSALMVWSKIQRPFMVYGLFDLKSWKYYKRVRISSSSKLINKENIKFSGDVYIGHYCIIDGIGGVTLSRGVQISSHTVIYSHSTQDSIRLLGDAYVFIETTARAGYIKKPVSIGEYTFVGTSSIILPGVTIGKGCIIGAGSLINKDVPDYSIVSGNPANVIGDTRTRDKEKYSKIIDEELYYNSNILNL